ncbi:MAG: hypothetical protein Crog4KO_32740 [Crocinitomicaceae bacterium]
MRYLFVIVILVGLIGCKKAEDRRCLKGAGEVTERIVPVGAFGEVFIGPNVSVVLVQDGTNEIHIIGGKNLVNFISTDITDNKLVITNENRCNFLRSYKQEITVEIHYTGLYKIEFEGTKPLSCESPILGNNLTVITRDGAGHVDLDVAYNNITYVVTNGWGNFDLSGSTNTLILDIRSNGFGSTYDLSIGSQLNVTSTTAGLLKVNTDNADCTFDLQSVGDLWYIGTPLNLDVTSSGDGEVINKN